MNLQDAFITGFMKAAVTQQNFEPYYKNEGIKSNPISLVLGLPPNFFTGVKGSMYNALNQQNRDREQLDIAGNAVAGMVPFKNLGMNPNSLITKLMGRYMSHPNNPISQHLYNDPVKASLDTYNARRW